ncbi:MAG TPA: methyltransferase domain-containing protein, partial [Rhodospirillales bacterium]|nr:methyltransferase domain-containing protein [Rhodospirillales bacterium]
MEAKKTEQTWNPDRYERNAGFVADLGTPVFDLLAPVADEKILDLGCGHGKLTGKFADLGADVTGVDASPEQIAACHKLGLNARVLSGESLDYNGDFDAVFSNAALHWMQKADDVIAGVYRALKPGGRFVGEMGGGDNVKKVSDALLAALAQRRIDGNALWPWYFPTTDDYRG